MFPIELLYKCSLLFLWVPKLSLSSSLVSFQNSESLKHLVLFCENKDFFYIFCVALIRAFLIVSWSSICAQASFLEGRNTFARFFSAVVGFSFAVAGFCNKVSAPNFYLFVLKWPSRHSHNFGAHNHLLVLCTIKCARVRCNAQCNAMQVNPWWRWQLCWAMHDLAIKAPLTNLALLRTMHSHTSTCLTFDKIKCILLFFFGQIYQVPKTLEKRKSRLETSMSDHQLSYFPEYFWGGFPISATKAAPEGILLNWKMVRML